MKKITIISSSLNPSSMSYFGAKKIEEIAKNKSLEVQFIDLRDYDMPLCDARKFDQYPEKLQSIAPILQASDAIIFTMPVYCYSVSGPLKNFLDIFAKDYLYRKRFGILEQAGTKLSYLAAADLHKILAFESEAQPILPIVLTDYSSYADGELTDPRALEKIDILLDTI